MAKKIWQKRRKALLQIAGTSGINIVFAGAPKPGAEIPSHIALTGADFFMCAMIYELYFGERISKDSILEILGDAGLLVVIGGGGGYAIAKGASGLIAEFTNFLGPLGWMASGLLAAGGTAALGLIWVALVDWAYRNQSSMTEAARAVS
jgi:hypothetical protein